MDDPSSVMLRARKAVAKTGKDAVVYDRGGRRAVLPLDVYLKAGLDSKGAKRVCVVAKCRGGSMKV